MAEFELDTTGTYCVKARWVLRRWKRIANFIMSKEDFDNPQIKPHYQYYPTSGKPENKK